MVLSRKRSSAREQFDNQRTLLEVLRVMAILIWIVYAFLSDPLSDIQTTAFLIIVGISMLNTAKLATQTIKNKEGSFYSQYIGLLFVFWFFLFTRIKDMPSFIEVTFFGFTFESIFQFQKHILGIALVFSSFIFNFINIKYIVQEKKTHASPYQLYFSYSYRALALGFFLIFVLTFLTWLPYFSDITVENYGYLDIVLALGIFFMLIYAFSSSNSQKKRVFSLGKIAVYSSILIFVIINILPGYIELLSVIHYTGTNNLLSNLLWQNAAILLFVLGIIAFMVSSSEQEPRLFTDDLKDKADTSISGIKSKMETKKRVKVKYPKKHGVNSKKPQSAKIYSSNEKLEIFVNIIKHSSSNISLEKLARLTTFETVEKLENWLIELNLSYLKVDWESSKLILSEDLKKEVKEKFIN